MDNGPPWPDLGPFRQVLQGFGAALASALMGRFMWHVHQVRHGARRFFSMELLWELPMAVGMAIIGKGVAEWLGLSGNSEAALGHGHFLAWIGAEFSMGERMAQNFIGVAAKFGANTQPVADLPPTVLYLLAAPSTPEVVTKEVTARAAAGDAPSKREIERLIKRAKDADVKADRARDRARTAEARRAGADAQVTELLSDLRNSNDKVRVLERELTEARAEPPAQDPPPAADKPALQSPVTTASGKNDPPPAQTVIPPESDVRAALRLLWDQAPEPDRVWFRGWIKPDP